MTRITAAAANVAACIVLLVLGYVAEVNRFDVFSTLLSSGTVQQDR